MTVAPLTTPPPRRDTPEGWREHPFWTELFGHSGPVEIEIGPGDGTFLLAAAARHPATNFLGIERSRAKARRLAARIARLGTPRIRMLHADATCVLAHLVPSGSVQAVHAYFPDPWPKRRHTRRRIFTADAIAALAAALAPGGPLHVATDVHEYACVIRARVLASGLFTEDAVDAAHPGLDSAFARKYRRAGRALHPASFLRRPSTDVC